MIYQTIFDFSILMTYLIILRWSIIENNEQVLLTGTILGLSLEILTIITTSRYLYGSFYLMIYEVPISIALSWGIIIYSAFTLTVNLDESNLIKACIGGIYGLQIDLVMDVLAIRIGFWDWGNLTDDYFGVPYGNFIAWFLILFFYLIVYRFLEEKTSINKYLIALITYLSSLIGIITNNFLMLYLRLNIELLFFTYFALIFSGAIMICLRSNLPFWSSLATSKPAILTQVTFHSFFTMILVIERIYIEIPLIGIIHIFLIGLFPYYDAILQRHLDWHHQFFILLTIVYILFILLYEIYH